MVFLMSEISIEAIGHGLRVARIRVRKSSSEAAEHAGVKVETIRRWERAGSAVTAVALCQLAEFYSTTVEAIVKDGVAA